MALVAGEHWSWYLDGQGYLAVELGDEWCFRTPYLRRQLSPYFVSIQRQPMSLNQAETYHRYCQQLVEKVPYFSEAQVTQAALNATALRYFLCMEANRSWQLLKAERSASEQAHSPSEWEERVAEVRTPHGKALVLTVLADHQAASVLLLGDLPVSDDLPGLEAFSQLRINVDRLSPLPSATPRTSYLPLRAVG